MSHLYTSKKNIKSIQYFMEHFLEVTYDGDEKLTHTVMREFLIEKGIPYPGTTIFKKVKVSQILDGEILLVKDEVGQTFAYHNPKKTLKTVLKDLQTQYDPDESERIREHILKEEAKCEKQKIYERKVRRRRK